MSNLIEITENLFTLQVLVPWILAMIFGVFVGSTPGLTATMAVALVIPLSYNLPKEAALAMVIGVSFTAIFAGDIPATFLRIPGTPASAAATLDAYQLAQKGKGRQTLFINLLCSALGGVCGVVILLSIAPQLAKLALLFSSFEYFWLCLLGLTLGVTVSSGNYKLSGTLAAFLGVLLATVGNDITTFQERYMFGNTELSTGLSFIPAMIGLFGISEVIRAVYKYNPLDNSSSAGLSDESSFEVQQSLQIIATNTPTIAQSVFTGTIIGGLPGAGADIAAWGAYGVAHKTAKPDEQKRFGTGIWKGVIAPTSANNAAVAAAWIPALVFGVPGDAVTAIVLGAFLTYDITPGPELFSDGGADFIFAIAMVTQLLLIPAGLLGILLFGKFMKLPRGVVLSCVVVFSVVGAYAMNNNPVDVWIMLSFGLLGVFLESHKVPLAPLILGMILGPKVETYFRQGMISAQGDFSLAFQSTIDNVLFSSLVICILLSIAMSLRKFSAKRPTLTID
ncbi:MAG: tripartite tricarboxylate transporter permease [Planctomycetaceae bacterium]|jgi:putative tricarboxylic transport membrane protein|nr:tripartite tricarboxylate transporter permease [Planctomycetaceae bacterium]